MDHPTRRMNSNEGINSPPDPRDIQIPPSRACMRCGAMAIWAKTRGYTGPVVMLPWISGLFTRGRETLALVCTTCGYTELYTYEAHKLLE